MTHKPTCPCPACRRRQGKAKIQKAFRLNADTLRRLEEAAQRTNRKQNEILEAAITKYLNE